MSKNSAMKDFAEKLCFTTKSAAKEFDASKKKEAFSFAEGYKAFLNAAKTEREAVSFAKNLAEKNGFLPLVYGNEYKVGDRVYYINRDKAMILAIIGEKDITEGVSIIASHIDAPRIDLKPNPLCEKESIAYFKTHYYGGIKKYQWPTVPLALHGSVILANGDKIDVCIGEEESDPIFYITDLLPHLAQDQMKRVAAELTPGENLTVIAGSLPIETDGEEVKESVKLNVLHFLNEKYGMTEEDFISAELMLVPALKARDVGFDRNLIASYAHDDRVCAYPSMMAFFEADKPQFTSVLVLADKEEIGSSGNTGLNTNFLYDFLLELCGNKNARQALANSWCLSADVNACYDPIFPEVYEKQNSSILNHGAIITKYTGARGKSGTSDASAEFMGKIRKILNENGVIWQIGELGKVDQGG
ncbi:MAG: aminopeptidase, partial [Clostridia bacterium]|nr:aminopeptidase [Clostridia bacterium]